MKFIKVSTLILTFIFTVNSTTLHANDATWYVTFDMQQILNSELIQFVPDDEDANQFLQKFPQEISQITMYGDSRGSEDATAVFRGDFSSFSAKDFLLGLIEETAEISDKISTTPSMYNNHLITVFSTDINNDNDDEQKHAYFSQINHDLAVMSFQKHEVEKWIDNTNPSIDDVNGSLFSVQVDVQSALTHMGVNIDDSNRNMMNSAVFKKVTQVSASINEDSSEVLIDVALTSSDEATAIQIEQVVNGLIAMKNLSSSEDDESVKVLMENLSIQREGNSLRLTSFASIEMLQQLKQKTDNFIVEDEINVNIKLGH